MTEKKAGSAVAVAGNSWLLGMFITDGMKRYPNTTWYDRTPVAQKGIAQEVALGQAGLLDKEGTELAAQAAKNLVDPAPVNVTATLLDANDRTYASLVGATKKETLTHCPEGGKSFEAAGKWIQAVLDALGAYL
jgi:hypothetical protein